MATREEALTELVLALETLPLRVRIEVVQRLVTAMQEQQRDQREQQVTAAVEAAQALPTHPDLRVKDLNDYLQELQDAFE